MRCIFAACKRRRVGLGSLVAHEISCSSLKTSQSTSQSTPQSWAGEGESQGEEKDSLNANRSLGPPPSILCHEWNWAAYIRYQALLRSRHLSAGLSLSTSMEWPDTDSLRRKGCLAGRSIHEGFQGLLVQRDLRALHLQIGWQRGGCDLDLR